jgi:hypothetical protein
VEAVGSIHWGAVHSLLVFLGCGGDLGGGASLEEVITGGLALIVSPTPLCLALLPGCPEVNISAPSRPLHRDVLCLASGPQQWSQLTMD